MAPAIKCSIHSDKMLSHAPKHSGTDLVSGTDRELTSLFILLTATWPAAVTFVLIHDVVEMCNFKFKAVVG